MRYVTSKGQGAFHLFSATAKGFPDPFFFVSFRTDLPPDTILSMVPISVGM